MKVENTKNFLLGLKGDYFFLDNHYIETLPVFGMKFPSAENAYQAAKIIPSSRGELCHCSPERAKEISQKLIEDGKGLYSKNVWFSIKIYVMYEILRRKFQSIGNECGGLMIKHNIAQFDEILATNHENDLFWGNGKSGEGENNLGKILLAIAKVTMKEKQ